MKKILIFLFMAVLFVPLQALAANVANESIEPATFAAGEEITIRFELRESPAYVSIDISKDDPVLHTIDCGLLGLGTHSVTWNGKDAQGNLLPSGEYVIDIIGDTYNFQLETCQVWAHLCVPHGIVFDTETSYYATNADFHNVINFFIDSEEYGDIYGGTSPGSALGEFNSPRGITIIKDGAGNRHLVVADSLNHRIQIISLEGAGGTKFYAFGSEGSGPFRFHEPYDVAVSPWDNSLNGCYLYVLDTGNCRVQQFEATFRGGAPHLDMVREWGQKGSGDMDLYVPEGIAVGPDGSVYVADTGNNRIVKYDRNGNFLAKTGTKGSQIGQFSRPTDIAVSNKGLVFVADKLNKRVQYFTESLDVMKAWETKLPPDMTVIEPVSVTVTGGGKVFITRADNAAFCPAVLGYQAERDIDFRTMVCTIADSSGSEEPVPGTDEPAPGDEPEPGPDEPAPGDEPEPGPDEPVPGEDEPEPGDKPAPLTGCRRGGSSMLFSAVCCSLLLLRRKNSPQA